MKESSPTSAHKFHTSCVLYSLVFFVPTLLTVLISTERDISVREIVEPTCVIYPFTYINFPTGRRITVYFYHMNNPFFILQSRR